MVGASCAAVVIGMTTVAIGWRIGPSAVTDLTIEDPMSPFQTKEAIVVERRTLPTVCRSAMAGLTVGSEPRLLMVRIPGAIVVVAMARHAGRRRAGKLPVHVALTAIRQLVLPQERKASVVVKDRTGPAGRRRAMTACAIGWKSSLLVIRARGPLVVVQVAAHTIR